MSKREQEIFLVVPTVDVGIMESNRVRIDFLQPYQAKETAKEFRGLNEFTAESIGGNELMLMPAQDKDSSTFEIRNVVIGKEFHWQQKENQRFRGSIILRKVGEKLLAINRLPVERYLESVISSEMNANASLELLKAHAVISRSWLMAQIRKSCQDTDNDSGMIDSEEERIRWYDHSQHEGFDVCADDHCQRYQGITRILNPNAVEAVNSTSGEVLMFDGEICDARFSKCCGGAFETFENCWQPVAHPYLKDGRDILPQEDYPLPDLTVEENARKWIEGRPAAFCNTDDAAVLRQVLNSYDQTTRDFYRWSVEYTREELSEIVKERSGIDFGEILDIVPIERGKSGRLVKIKIIGTLRTMTIGKELEIRRTLSRSHLYSSAFIVEKAASGFIFSGAGWGHGAGLCQIGAAIMAHRGYTYREILSHYYPGSQLTRLI